MHRLLQRLQRQQLERRLHRRLLRPCVAVVSHELAQCLQRQLPEPLPLGEQPMLERRLVDGHSGEQVPLIELSSLFEGGRSGLGHQPLEGSHIHIDEGGFRARCSAS
jgi:hypothetical protein